MGGRNLRKAGVETIVDSETSASVMGFTELFGSFGRILKAYSTMKSCIKTWKPDLLILLDFPDFNLRLARVASTKGTKVLYFISPQVWAWRTSRVEFFKKYLDQIAVIFPFEKEFLESHGFNKATFVGHPFLDVLKSRTMKTKQQIKEELELSEKPVLAVFPGSRKSEIEKHLNVMIDGLRKFNQDYPDVQIVLNVAPSLDINFILEKVSRFENLKIVKKDPLDIMQVADAGLLKSGTSNLQAAALGLPFCMFYIASPLSAFIVRKLVKIKQYSIVNILKPGAVSEILQENATTDSIYNELKNVLFNTKFREKMKQDFSNITASLHHENHLLESAADRVAKLAARLITPAN